VLHSDLRPKDYKFPIVWLLRCKETSSVPYATFVLSFGSFMYQIFLTGEAKEARGNRDPAQRLIGNLLGTRAARRLSVRER
jgi:hypothetical protein